MFNLQYKSNRNRITNIHIITNIFGNPIVIHRQISEDGRTISRQTPFVFRFWAFESVGVTVIVVQVG